MAPAYPKPAAERLVVVANPVILPPSEQPLPDTAHLAW